MMNELNSCLLTRLFTVSKISIGTSIWKSSSATIYHGNDGITKTIPIRLFANLNPFSWDSSDWRHREKRQQLSTEGKPVIVKVSRCGDYYRPLHTTLPYTVTILLPVSIDFLSVTGKPHNTRVTIVFTIGTINNIPMVTINDVTGFETTDSHVRRWYLEKALIPHLDKLFKGETNDWTHYRP